MALFCDYFYSNIDKKVNFTGSVIYVCQLGDNSL